MNLIVLSPEQHLSGNQKPVSETEILLQLFENGLQRFHLRKPAWNFLQLQHYINSVPEKFHNRIVLHSHFELAAEFAVTGIHKKTEAHESGVTEWSCGQIISTSFHSLREIESCHYPYEYVFLSPVFDSISKPGYRSAFDPGPLSTFLQFRKKENSNPPLIVALGGVSASNLAKLKTLGFDGAAVLGSIWESQDPLTSFLEIQTACAV
jgi:thiamine-phosphate pyrophosphorylase